MPSVSQSQNAFAAMSKTAKGRAILRRSGKKPMPVSVAAEYLSADKGRKIGALPKHVKPK